MEAILGRLVVYGPWLVLALVYYFFLKKLVIVKFEKIGWLVKAESGNFKGSPISYVFGAINLLALAVIYWYPVKILFFGQNYVGWIILPLSLIVSLKDVRKEELRGLQGDEFLTLAIIILSILTVNWLTGWIVVAKAWGWVFLTPVLGYSTPYLAMIISLPVAAIIELSARWKAQRDVKAIKNVLKATMGVQRNGGLKTIITVTVICLVLIAVIVYFGIR